MDNFPVTKPEHKLADSSERTLRIQQMSMPEYLEIIHRYTPVGGIFAEICAGTGQAIIACAILGR